uniref:Peptidase S1 domain-containing protein n=1 Tax=Leptobrachium leishanense TaxID=445787 RepID=A0A8C5QAE5_9ANUR
MVSYYQAWIKYNIPEMTFSTVSILPVPPSVSSPPVCGSPVVSSRIGGGADAKYGEWPWQVAVVYDGVYRCGGSLISEQWVLSGAQCFNMEADTRRYMIFMGAHQFSGSNDHMKFSFVERIITHYRYESVTSKGDIALVKLSNPVTYTDYIRPICLPSSSVTFPSGTECWVTGWGDVAYGVSLPNPKTLQEVKVHLIDYKECEQMYNTGSSVVYTIEKEMICAGYKEGGKASCQGDSGGPVVCKVNGAWIQAGIVSFAQGCALPNRPGVNTLVPAYQSWIKTYIPEQQFVTVSISGAAGSARAPWKNVLFCILFLSRVLN